MINNANKDAMAFLKYAIFSLFSRLPSHLASRQSQFASPLRSLHYKLP
jgi:hypothetical protein